MWSCKRIASNSISFTFDACSQCRSLNYTLIHPPVQGKHLEDSHFWLVLTETIYICLQRGHFWLVLTETIYICLQRGHFWLVLTETIYISSRIIPVFYIYNCFYSMFKFCTGNIAPTWGCAPSILGRFEQFLKTNFHIWSYSLLSSHLIEN
jgi:hypothetical protein